MTHNVEKWPPAGQNSEAIADGPHIPASPPNEALAAGRRVVDEQRLRNTTTGESARSCKILRLLWLVMWSVWG